MEGTHWVEGGGSSDFISDGWRFGRAKGEGLEKTK
jgi:hypothetical protein